MCTSVEHWSLQQITSHSRNEVTSNSKKAWYLLRDNSFEMSVICEINREDSCIKWSLPIDRQQGRMGAEKPRGQSSIGVAFDALV